MMNDEFQIPENAILFADSNRGQYIPRYFAEVVRRELVTGVEEEDYNILLDGPDHELYDDVWCGVLDSAVIKHPTLGDCYLYQDGDLWIIPKDQPLKEEE